jgi:hypothetical protein
LREAARVLDISQPVAVMALMVLHYIPDERRPEPGLVRLPQWRATADPDFVIACLAGVGRKR